MKVSTNQGDADGAVRGSNCSRRGTKHEARFLFMTGSCFEQDGDLRDQVLTYSLTSRKGGGHIPDSWRPDKAKC